MSEHTPGPWLYDGIAEIVEAERPHMRMAFLPSNYYQDANTKANGRLIAAAPDLLAALQELLTAEAAAWVAVGDDRPAARERLFHARNKAVAAIAKATGAKP